MNKALETATFGGGCFWCTEAVFKRIKGVENVESGYSGGDVDNPGYEDVSSGQTNHAESIQLTYNPKVISYKELLEIFFNTHNPTTRNRQGNDVGTQYRSVIFYHDEKQKMQAEEAIKEIEQSGQFSNPVVTEIIPFEKFYKAEDYHQNYYDNNRQFPYCTVIIDPKIKKLLEKYGENVKNEYK